VDDLPRPALEAGPRKLWLGAVVPKRHARRAVTRCLLKRQIRAVVSGHADALARGLWVVRLRAPFDRAGFVSAASDGLKRAARAELEQLMRGAAQR
jgi:ribonuclease P protein component